MRQGQKTLLVLFFRKELLTSASPASIVPAGEYAAAGEVRPNPTNQSDVQRQALHPYRRENIHETEYGREMPDLAGTLYCCPAQIFFRRFHVEKVWSSAW
jgi:hypothetical protein